MLAIKDILVNEELLCEAFIEPHMVEFAKQLKEKNIKISDVVWRVTNALDEIDRSDVTVYKNINKDALKDIKRVAGDYNVLIIGLINGVVKIVRNGAAITYLIPVEPIGRDNIQYGQKFTNELDKYYDPYPGKRHKNSATAYLDAFEHCDEAWIIDMRDLNTDKKRDIRRETYKGVVLNTPDYYEKQAQENIERYKKIIANKHASGDSEINKINKQIQTLFAEYTAIITDFNINPGKYANYSIRTNIDITGEVMKSVISELKNYTDKKYKLSEYLNKGEVSTSSWGNADYYTRNLNDARKSLYNVMEKMELHIKKVKDAVND